MCRYGLDFPSVSPAEEEETAPGAGDEPRDGGAPAEGRRHLSAIERRRMKKAGAGVAFGGEGSGSGEPSGQPSQAGSSGVEAASSGRAQGLIPSSSFRLGMPRVW